MALLRKVLLLLSGAVLTLLGLVGLVLPVMPGLVFLVAAAGCFSLASRRFRVTVERRLRRHPRYRRTLRHWRSGQGLPFGQRLQLGFWLMVGSLVPGRRG
jgi:uncharacterized protein